MNSKLLSGSLLAAVANAWLGHLFFAPFTSRGEPLESVGMESGGSFDPGPYGGSPEATAVFLGLRVLIWVVLLGGLVVWGAYEEWEGEFR